MEALGPGGPADASTIQRAMIAVFEAAADQRPAH
jgi:hypothetical protein